MSNRLKLPILVLSIAFLMVVSLPPLSADMKVKYRLNPSGLPDTDAMIYSGSMLATGPHRAIFIYADTGVSLKAHGLDSSGATGTVTTVFQTAPTSGYIADWAAVWTGTQGLLFVVKIDNIEQPGKHTVSVSTFDNTGEPKGRTRQLFATFRPQGGARITVGWNGTEALAAFTAAVDSPYYAPDNTPKAKAWAFTLDAAGKKRSAVQELSLAYAGDHTLDAILGTPVWNGSRWLIPAWGSAYHVEWVPSKPSGNHYVEKSRNLAIFSLTGGAKSVIRAEVMEHLSSDPTVPEIRSAIIIPDPRVAAKGKTLKLPMIVQTADYSPIAENIEWFHSSWRLQYIGKHGAPAGAMRALTLPAWKHRLLPQAGWFSTGQIDELTPAVLAADGSVYLAHSRSLTRFRWVYDGGGSVTGREYRFDSQLDLYRFDAKAGTLAAVGEYRPKTDRQYLESLLQPLDAGVAILNRAVTWGADTTGALDFSLNSYFTALQP